MNGFSGVWFFDGRPVDATLLSRCAYRSPMWEPDHLGIRLFDGAGFTSTQRFVMPEEPHALMPFEDVESGCVIVADSLLAHREELADALGVAHAASDCELILAAWKKWGAECPRRLFGHFSFFIWDPRNHRAFAATDHFGMRPLYYAFEPGRGVTISNTMEPFRILRQGLTINLNQFQHFAVDTMPAGETCYREVAKLPAAHSLLVTPERARTRRYWRLKEQRHRLPQSTREDYYEAFRERFARAVGTYLRTEHPVLAYISGGLDSSSVASMAAKLLGEANRNILGFTAIPHTLEGSSRRRGWYYHELPVARSISEQYPNVLHHVYRTDPDADPLRELSALHSQVDHPARNVMNWHWINGAFRHAIANGSRLTLGGDRGNGNISWDGADLRSRYNLLRGFVRNWPFVRRLLPDAYLEVVNPGVLRVPAVRAALRKRGCTLDLHYWMLAMEPLTPGFAYIRHPALYHGVEHADPTSDVPLTEFCFNLPEWVHYRMPRRERRPQHTRLLVREGLAGIVPEAVRFNVNRGEQAADAYLQYNRHGQAWRTRLDSMSPAAASVFERCIDRAALRRIFDNYPHIAEPPDEETEFTVCIVLARALAAADFIDFLDRNSG